MIGKGWLPEIIPPSSRKITTSNDLDLNMSDGEFYFDEIDGPAFLSQLKPYAGRKSPWDNLNATVEDWKRNGYLPYEYVKDDTVWIFFINLKKGHAAYQMWLNRKEHP